MATIAVIAGLGNPGAAYEGSRHNIGFSVLDALADTCGVRFSADSRHRADSTRCVQGDAKLWLLKPLTYVNCSGESIGSFCRYHHISAAAVAVVYDDITLDPGRLKLSTSGSAGGHNGVADIIRHIGDTFCRVRIGIGGKPHPEADLKDFVLGRFSESEQARIQCLMPKYLAVLKCLVDNGVQVAMNQFNGNPIWNDTNNNT